MKITYSKMHLWIKTNSFTIGFTIGLAILTVFYWNEVCMFLTQGQLELKGSECNLFPLLIPCILGTIFYLLTFLIPKVKCKKCKHIMKLKRDTFYFYKCTNCQDIVNSNIKIPGGKEMNKNTKKVPTEPFEINSATSGFLPDKAIHRKGDLYIQEPSYSFIIFFLVMLLCSIMCIFLPLDNKSKYMIAGVVLWGGVCVLIAYIIMKKVSQKIIIDRDNGMIKIIKKGLEQNIPIKEIIGLQILYQVDSSTQYNKSGFQLILVRKSDEGNYERYLLYKHKNQSFVKSLGKQYKDIIGLNII